MTLKHNSRYYYVQSRLIHVDSYTSNGSERSCSQSCVLKWWAYIALNKWPIDKMVRMSWSELCFKVIERFEYRLRVLLKGIRIWQHVHAVDSFWFFVKKNTKSIIQYSKGRKVHEVPSNLGSKFLLGLERPVNLVTQCHSLRPL